MLLFRTMKLHECKSHVQALSIVGILATCTCCLGEPHSVEVPLADAELQILFVGNSLTYANDLPSMVQTLAEATGHTLAWRLVAAPNASLEDHWYGGIETTIRATAADVVIMQQGPSSLPESQDHLLAWTEVFAEVIREAEGAPALFMVWPETTRIEAFDDVYRSYRNAARNVDGLLAPAGEAWRYAWEQDPALHFYAHDGFHPSALGSQVAALTLFRILFNEPLTDLPPRFVSTTEGLPVVDFGDNASLVYDAVEDAIAAANTVQPL